MSISGTNEATQSIPFGTDVVATGDTTSNGTAATPARSNHVHKGVVNNDAWTAYTPSNTGITIGNGTQLARYQRVGRLITVQYQLTWGSTTAFTAGPTVGLPVTAVGPGQFIGNLYCLDSGTAERHGIWIASGSSGYFLVGTGTLAAASPHTWAINDVLAATLTYEAAS